MEIEMLIQKAESGDENAQYELGDAYYYGVCGEDDEEVKKDTKQAVEWYQKAAERGHVEAQTRLAWMYQYGKGVRKNHKQAILWYKKSAAQGSVPALLHLGETYEAMYLKGVEQSTDNAAQWYRKAAKHGIVSAQLKLAEFAEDSSPQEAAYWLQQAANADDILAQEKLARCFEHGIGVPKNEAEAFLWYLSAEKLDHESGGYFDVGRCYAFGIGIKKNPKEALKRLLPIANPKTTGALIRMACAQVCVAKVYLDAENGEPDLIEGYAWCSLVATYARDWNMMSRESALDIMSNLEEQLTKDQLQQAQKRSGELFVPEKEIHKRLGDVTPY
ncbi:MAG: tetratricopeptide repeat protein [Verrucomicrobia bacterium]|nr:tetratricopeptide repeat protein [Verrucomicrobiota bacterium]